MIRKKTKRIIVLIGAALFMRPAFADQPISMIKTLCIPDAGIDYFSAETGIFEQAAAYIDYGRNGHAPRNKEDRIRALASHGLLLPSDFSYDCLLSSAQYNIFGSRTKAQPKGMCGGDPRTVLSLKRNDRVILDKVFFESSCFDDVSNQSHPFVKSFAVEEYSGAWGGGYVTLVLSDGHSQQNLRLSLSKQKPFRQETLKCLVNENFFQADRKSNAEIECLSQ